MIHKKLTVAIAPEVWDQFMALTKVHNEEVGALLDVTQDGDYLFVDKLVPVKQTAGPADVDFDEVIFHGYFKEKGVWGQPMPYLTFGWWHSHVNMGVTPSGTDQSTIEKFCLRGYMVTLISNKRGELTVKVHTVAGSEDPREGVLIEVPCDWCISYDNRAAMESWAKEWLETYVTRRTVKTYAPTHYNARGGYRRSSYDHFHGTHDIYDNDGYYTGYPSYQDKDGEYRWEALPGGGWERKPVVKGPITVAPPPEGYQRLQPEQREALRQVIKGKLSIRDAKDEQMVVDLVFGSNIQEMCEKDEGFAKLLDLEDLRCLRLWESYEKKADGKEAIKDGKAAGLETRTTKSAKAPKVVKGIMAPKAPEEKKDEKKKAAPTAN